MQPGNDVLGTVSGSVVHPNWSRVLGKPEEEE